MKIILPMRPQPSKFVKSISLYENHKDLYIATSHDGFLLKQKWRAPYAPGDEIVRVQCIRCNETHKPSEPQCCIAPDLEEARYRVLAIEPRDLRKFTEEDAKELGYSRLSASCGHRAAMQADFQSRYPDDPYAWAWVLDVEETKGE